MLQSLQAQTPQQIALSLANDPTALTNVLNMLSANDTATIKEGERLLKPFLKNPPCIASLINQLTTVVDVSVRHHSALLLKKKAIVDSCTVTCNCLCYNFGTFR